MALVRITGNGRGGPDRSGGMPLALVNARDEAWGSDLREGQVVYGSEDEKPISKRTRIVVVLLSWLVFGIPLFVGLWFWFGWWVLVLFAGAVWATFDYMKRGDMFSSVDHMMSHHVRTGEDGESRFGVDD